MPSLRVLACSFRGSGQGFRVQGSPQPLTIDTRGGGGFRRKGGWNNHLTKMCSGSETGSYLRLMDPCITQLKDLLGPLGRVKKKEKKGGWNASMHPSIHQPSRQRWSIAEFESPSPSRPSVRCRVDFSPIKKFVFEKDLCYLCQSMRSFSLNSQF